MLLANNNNYMWYKTWHHHLPWPMPGRLTIFSAFELKKVMLFDYCNVYIISNAASIFLIATNPCPYLAIASETKRAASASPSALRIAACFSCSLIITMNLDFSASCCATCFFSIDCAKSRENCKWVIETSSRMISNSFALFERMSLISSDTFSLWVRS